MLSNIRRLLKTPEERRKQDFADKLTAWDGRMKGMHPPMAAAFTAAAFGTALEHLDAEPYGCDIPRSLRNICGLGIAACVIEKEAGFGWENTAVAALRLAHDLDDEKVEAGLRATRAICASVGLSSAIERLFLFWLGAGGEMPANGNVLERLGWRYVRPTTATKSHI